MFQGGARWPYELAPPWSQGGLSRLHAAEGVAVEVGVEGWRCCFQLSDDFVAAKMRDEKRGERE